MKKQPMTKAEKYRRASKVVWLAGAVLTWFLVKGFVPGSSDTNNVLPVIIAVATALGIQYVLTLVEGTIIDGILPMPQDLDFINDMTRSVLAVFAYGCFILDVMINLGGTRVIVAQSGVTDNFLILLISVFLSSLMALGSELLDGLADQYEGKPQVVREHRSQTSPQKPTTQEHDRMAREKVEREQAELRKLMSKQAEEDDNRGNRKETITKRLSRD